MRYWLAEKITKQSGYSNAGGIDPISVIASAAGDLFKLIGTGVGAGASNKAVKAGYKDSITSAAISYRAEQEKNRKAEQTTNVLLVAGASLVLLGVGALIYFGSVKGQKQQPILQVA